MAVSPEFKKAISEDSIALSRWMDDQGWSGARQVVNVSHVLALVTAAHGESSDEEYAEQMASTVQYVVSQSARMRDLRKKMIDGKSNEELQEMLARAQRETGLGR